MVVGIVNKITGIIYILVGVILMVLGILLVQLIWNMLPIIETLSGISVPAEYFYAVAALLILPWIFFIIHGVAHYLIGRQIE